MESVAHWTQNSTADFIHSISSNFVAQIETKIEEEGISQNEIASKMNKTSGRVSQLLNNPGNLSIRVMVELARSLGMKVSIIAYDDKDPNNDQGPIDPEVFVRSWEKLDRPVDLFEVEEAVLPVDEMPMVTYNVGYEHADVFRQDFTYGYVCYSAPIRFLPNPSVELLNMYPAKTKPPTQVQIYGPGGLMINQTPLLSERKAA
jgi:transcriptional regulator with XRE-family HTH domain